MKKTNICNGGSCVSHFKKLLRIMKLTCLLVMIALVQVSAATYAQSTKLTLNMKNARLAELFEQIEDNSEFRFFYDSDEIDLSHQITIRTEESNIDEILTVAFSETNYSYEIIDRHIIIKNSGLSDRSELGRADQMPVSGLVTDKDGFPLPGVTVIVKGTTKGTVTNANGEYSINGVSEGETLQFSFIGMMTQEVVVGTQTDINVSLQVDAIGIEEVVAVGYGSMKKSDLTGAITNVDMNDFRDQSSTTLTQALQGAVAGLNVGQVNVAGEGPSISIRGRTSLSGTQNPLIILDGVIYRGRIIDINPNDISSIDILKDNSATAVYGSQAANGVIIITTTRKDSKPNGRPIINYSAKYSFDTPINELEPGDSDYFVEKIAENEWRESRTEESGYIDANPDWDVNPYFKTNQQSENYLAGKSTNWYDLLTNDKMYTNSHNLSLANQTDYSNYFISVGYTDQQGYMINEGYERINARINIDSKVTDWLTVGVQSFYSTSDYSGVSPGTSSRYIMPFESAYDEDGELLPMLENNAWLNPLVEAQADNEDVRQNLFGNIYAEIKFPFLEGLTYKVNYANNQTMNRYYIFRPWDENFQGRGSKENNRRVDVSFDNNLNYKRKFGDNHSIDVTFVYGIEEREYEYTTGVGSIFINDVLGYNALQFGESELQEAFSGGWKESSLFSMGRFFYSYKNKYMLTGTFRRDGFSGFSENNKFGFFPSGSIGWVVSEEPFFNQIADVMNYMKVRASYGKSGNRTVGRYQTMAKVGGGYNYVDASGASIYTQSITSLASPSLKWETTTGINLGVDFGFLDSRINGSINYYNNNTSNLLYTVDIPSIGRFTQFPDNLGKIHNSGVELTINSVNIQNGDFSWTSEFSFSRNRDELKELLGADNDGDGIEDDLISEGLFIGHSLNTIYAYEISGEIYQLGDEIPSGFDVGTNKIVDQNDDGEIDPDNDKVILGYADPSYRFGINNHIRYKDWSLSFFINSIQGGKDYYLQANDLNYIQYGDQYNESYPEGYDNYWLPENPDAKYQKNSLRQPGDMKGRTYAKRNFIRLQDVSLGYNFNSSFLNKLNIENLRLFVSGKNLLTITDWQGWDPETGQSVTLDGRPVMKSYTIGLNIEL